MSDRVQVRQLRDEDRVAWDELWRGYLRFYRADVSAAVTEATFARLRDERGAERVYWHTQQYNGAARSLYDTVGNLTSFIVYEHELGD